MNNLNISKKRAINAGSVSLQRQIINSSPNQGSKTQKKSQCMHQNRKVIRKMDGSIFLQESHAFKSPSNSSNPSFISSEKFSNIPYGSGFNQTSKKIVPQNLLTISRKINQRMEIKTSLQNNLGKSNKCSNNNQCSNRSNKGGIQSKIVSQKISPRLYPSNSQESVNSGSKGLNKNLTKIQPQVSSQTSNMIENKLQQKLINIQKSLAVLKQNQYRQSNQMKALLKDFSIRIKRCEDQQKKYLDINFIKLQKSKQSSNFSPHIELLEKRVKQLQEFRKSLLAQTSFISRMEKFKLQNGNITPIKHSSIKSPRNTIFGDIALRGRKNGVSSKTPTCKKGSLEQDLAITVSPNQMDKTMQFQYSPNSESNQKASPKKNAIATPLGGFNKKITKVTQINLQKQYMQCLKQENSSGKGQSSRSSSRNQNNILHKFTTKSQSNSSSNMAIQSNFLNLQKGLEKKRQEETVSENIYRKENQLIKSPPSRGNRQYYSSEPTNNKFLVSKKPIQPSLDQNTNHVTPFMTTLLTNQQENNNTTSSLMNYASSCKDSNSLKQKKQENKLQSFKEKRIKESNQKEGKNIRNHPIFSNMADNKDFKFEQPPMSPIPFQQDLAGGSQSPNEFFELQNPCEISNNIVPSLQTNSSGLDPIIGIGGYGIQSDKINEIYRKKNKAKVAEYKQNDRLNQTNQESKQIIKKFRGSDFKTPVNDGIDSDERLDSPLPADQLDSNPLFNQKSGKGNNTSNVKASKFRSNNSSVNSVPQNGLASQNISQKLNSFKLINSLNSNNCIIDSKSSNLGESCRIKKVHFRNPSIRRQDKNFVNSMIMVPQIDLQSDQQIHRANQSFTLPQSQNFSQAYAQQNAPQNNIQFTSTEAGHEQRILNEKSNSPHFLIMQQQEDKNLESDPNTNQIRAAQVKKDSPQFKIKDIQKFSQELDHIISDQDLQSDYNYNNQNNQSGEYVTQKKRIPSIIKMPMQAPSVMRAPTEEPVEYDHQSNNMQPNSSNISIQKNATKLFTTEQKQYLTPSMPFEQRQQNKKQFYSTPGYEETMQADHRKTINSTNLQRPRNTNQDCCSQNLCQYEDDQREQEEQCKIKGIKFIDRGQNSLSPNQRRNFSKPAAATAGGMRVNSNYTGTNFLFNSGTNTHSAATLLQTNTLGKITVGGGATAGYISHTVSNIFSPKNNNVAAVPIDQQCICKPFSQRFQEQYLDYESSIQFKSQYSNNYSASIRNKNVKDSFEYRKQTPQQDDFKMINQAFPEPCGQFCKNLQPHIQKQLIYETLMEQIGEPVNKSTVGKPSSKKFLISAQWWRKWKDYVEFDFQTQNQSNLENTAGSSHLLKDGDCLIMNDEQKPQDIQLLNITNSHEEFIHKLKNQNDRDFLETLKSQKQSDNMMRQYDYPGPITNADILQPGSTFYLRSEILQHYDFEALSPSIWRYLNSWYGSDFNITRFLVKDKMNPSKLILEMYPKDPSSMAGRTDDANQTQYNKRDKNYPIRGKLNSIKGSKNKKK